MSLSMAAPKRRPQTVPKLKATDKKTAAMKELLLEQLGKAPIVTAAVRAAGVGRATYYKWHDEDADFARSADSAIAEGRKFVNDIAFSKLMQCIDAGSITAIIFWLKHNHPWFAERIRYEHTHDHEHRLIGDGILTSEQREQLVQAFRLSGMTGTVAVNEELRKKFLESKGPEKPEDRVSDWGTGKPQARMKEEVKRGGLKIEEFLKSYKPK